MQFFIVYAVVPFTVGAFQAFHISESVGGQAVEHLQINLSRINVV
jgi:hypothetical protein